MDVFLSWSGEKSKAAAEVFRWWLPVVLQSIQPRSMSDQDIGTGRRWWFQVGRAMEQAKFGILFVTDTNFSAPWFLFEAGFLAKVLDETFICPYLVGVEPEALLSGPLTQFQAKRAVRGDTLDLVTTLNRGLGDQALSDETLLTIFERLWPDLEAALRALPCGAAPMRSHERGGDSGENHRSVNETWDFDVAISFAGAQRAIAQQLASLAEAEGIRVFYDMSHAAELWGEDLTIKLDAIYREKARFCVALVSRDYAEREWTQYELRSARARAIKEKSAYILPLRLEEGVVLEGVPDTIGYISLTSYTLAQVVAILLQKLGKRSEKVTSI